MFDISQPIKNELVYQGRVYQLFLSFDEVLRLFDMWKSDEVADLEKPYFAMIFLTRSYDFNERTFDEITEIYEKVFDDFIKIKQPTANAPRYDLEGNLLPEVPEEVEDDDLPAFSFKYDSEYIFASFMQAYGIDLIEEQGRLSWQKFNALLAGLPEDTKLAKVMEIRSWKPSDTKDRKERERRRKLQKLYAIPEE